MADNIQLNAGTGGSVLATDDVGGAQYQRIKPAFGADGAATDVSLTTPLPTSIPSQVQTITVPAGSGARNIGLIDLTGSAHWTVAPTALGANLSGALQFSNDQVNWYPVQAENYTNAGVPGSVVSTTAATSYLGSVGSMIAAPTMYRYMRLSTSSAATTGTYTYNVTTLGYPVRLSTQLAQAVNGQYTSTGDGATPPNTIATNALGYAFNGTNWDRLRTPKVFKSLAINTTGYQYIWTPTTGKAFRLMRYKMTLAANATQGTSGELTAWFGDGGTQLPMMEGVYVPSATTVTGVGAWSTGWIDLGNGYLSPASNSSLQVNISANIGNVSLRVFVAGTEE